MEHRAPKNDVPIFWLTNLDAGTSNPQLTAVSSKLNEFNKLDQKKTLPTK